jgi:hypothetical protein
MNLIDQFERVSREINLYAVKNKDLTPLAHELSGLVSLLNTEMAVKIPAIEPYYNALADVKAIEKVSDIDKRGLGDTILRRIREGSTVEDLCFEFDLTKGAVDRWLKEYNSLAPKDRIEKRKSSVFNITEQLEDLYARILEDVENMREVNPDTVQKLNGNLLTCLKMASEIVERFEEMQKAEQLKQEIARIFDRVSPGIGQELIKALSDNRDHLNLLSPRRR